VECSLAPEVPEPGRRQLGVDGRVLDVLVSEPGLQRARVVTLVGQREVLVSSGERRYSL
jgi:hypothetical protein